MLGSSPLHRRSQQMQCVLGQRSEDHALVGRTTQSYCLSGASEIWAPFHSNSELLGVWIRGRYTCVNIRQMGSFTLRYFIYYGICCIYCLM